MQAVVPLEDKPVKLTTLTGNFFMYDMKDGLWIDVKTDPEQVGISGMTLKPGASI
tara:strand:- start:5341 stop:5505 length:165 start_codon:yes stop_codon:yes gene_type:complete